MGGGVNKILGPLNNLGPYSHRLCSEKVHRRREPILFGARVERARRDNEPTISNPHAVLTGDKLASLTSHNQNNTCICSSSNARREKIGEPAPQHGR